MGQEFSGYAAQLASGRADQGALAGNLLKLAIGGTAVGTGLNAPKGWADDIRRRSRHRRQPFEPAPNKFAEMAAHDTLVFFHGALTRWRWR